MNRRDILKAGVAAAAAPGVVSASGEVGCGNPLAIRVSTMKEDIGYFPAIHSHGIKILLDGEDVGDSILCMTIDERNGYVIGYHEGEAKITNGILAYQKIEGNFTISGLADDQRAAHIEMMKHRAVMDEQMITQTAMEVLSNAINENDEFAWGWHCNIAVAAQDEGMSHEDSQKVARRFMGWAFGRSDYPDHWIA